MARNYSTFPGKIKSYAKGNEIEIPEENDIRAGYKRLRRAEITHPEEGRDTVIVGDKLDYIKLTDHGLTLVTQIDSSEELEKDVKRQIGVETDEQEDWWPHDYDSDDASVSLKAISDRPADNAEEYEIEAVAEFTCPRCRSTVTHSYTFKEPDDTWSKKVSTTCLECDIEWEHIAGNPYTEPRPID
jgi:DNA-directed RNA polymerase subunit M/transcription elongation factor TFIIS